MDIILCIGELAVSEKLAAVLDIPHLPSVLFALSSLSCFPLGKVLEVNM